MKPLRCDNFLPVDLTVSMCLFVVCFIIAELSQKNGGVICVF